MHLQNMKIAKIIFFLLFQVFLTGVSFAQDFAGVKYGTETRQFMDIWIAPSTKPTPVYLHAHGNGGDTSMPTTIVSSLKSNGISIVAWESLTSVNTEAQIQTGWDDCELMYAWVKANAATYNFDTTKFIIGGQSRGSIISWRYAQRPNPNNVGIYMYNALPSVWLDPTWWLPTYDIKVTAPPIFLVYQNAPGCSTLTPTDPNYNIHDPNYGYRVMDRYTNLGIGDRDTLIHSIGVNKVPDPFQYLLQFALKVIQPSLPMGVNSIAADNSNLKVLPDPFSNHLTFTISENEPAAIILFDFLSRKILQQPFTSSTTINTQQFKNGIYFYQIMNSKSIIANGKVIKY